MKADNMRKIIVIIVTLLMILSACASEPEPTTVPTTEPTAAPTAEPTVPPTEEPTEASTTAPTEPSTEPHIEPTEPPVRWIQGRDSFEDVVVHPYTPDELQDAVDVAMSILNGYKEKEHVLDFQVHWIAFDPVGTDKYFLDYGPNKPWETEDPYHLWIRLAINFTVHYDHTMSPEVDRENHIGYIALSRDSIDSPWELDRGQCTDTVPGNLASTVVMPLAEVDALGLTEAPVLAAYRLVVDLEEKPYLADQNLDPQNVYVLYVWDGENQTIRCEIHPIED